MYGSHEVLCSAPGCEQRCADAARAIDDVPYVFRKRRRLNNAMLRYVPVVQDGAGTICERAKNVMDLEIPPRITISHLHAQGDLRSEQEECLRLKSHDDDM